MQSVDITSSLHTLLLLRLESHSLLGKDWCGGSRVNTQHTRNLHDFEDFLSYRPVADGVLDMKFQTFDVEMSGGSGERDVHELLHLRREDSRVPRYRRELGVGMLPCDCDPSPALRLEHVRGRVLFH